MPPPAHSFCFSIALWLGLLLLSCGEFASATSFPGSTSSPTAPCVKRWSGPSADNDFSQCTNQQVLQDWFISKSPGIVFPIVIGLFVFLSCPFVFAGRHCCQCCGGSTQTPGVFCCISRGDIEEFELMHIYDVELSYSKGEVSRAKHCPLLLLVLGIVFVIITYLGSGKLVKGINGVGIGIQQGVDLVHGIVHSFVEGTMRTDGTNFVSLSDFSIVLNATDSILVEYNKEKYQEWVRLGITVADLLKYLTILPGAFMLLTVVAAFVHLRSCVPTFIALFFFLFALIYGTTGTAFLAAHLPVDTACGEVTAQLKREPSILQWYVVPTCEKTNLLQDLVSEVTALESKAAELSCKATKEVCSSVADPATSLHQFSCNLTLGENCTTIDQAKAFSDSMVVKPDANETCGGKSSCPLCACGKHCTLPNVKEAAAAGCEAISDGSLVVNSFASNVAPLLDCNTLLDKLVVLLTPVCDELPDGFYFLGVGSSLVVFSVLLGLVLVFRGQKRWFVRPSEEVDLDESLVDDQQQPQPNYGTGSEKGKYYWEDR